MHGSDYREKLLHRQRQEMYIALKREIPFVSYSDHEQDNTFIRSTLEATISCIPDEFLPIGFCYNPDYRPEAGVAFVLRYRETEIEFWAHVPKVCFERWLDDAGLFDTVFPNGTRGIYKEKT